MPTRSILPTTSLPLGAVDNNHDVASSAPLPLSSTRRRSVTKLLHFFKKKDTPLSSDALTTTLGPLPSRKQWHRRNSCKAIHERSRVLSTTHFTTGNESLDQGAVALRFNASMIRPSDTSHDGSHSGSGRRHSCSLFTPACPLSNNHGNNNHLHLPRIELTKSMSYDGRPFRPLHTVEKRNNQCVNCDRAYRCLLSLSSNFCSLDCKTAWGLRTGYRQESTLKIAQEELQPEVPELEHRFGL